MAQLGFFKLSNEWTALSDLITVGNDVTYYIQNRGTDNIIALQSTSEPTGEERGGNLIPPEKAAEYKKGTQDLYLKASSFTQCEINITSED